MTSIHTGKTTSLESPPSDEAREQVWAEALSVMGAYSRSQAPHRSDLQSAGRRVLLGTGLADRYLGYAMVQVNNAFWLDQFLSVPRSQRLLMLPRCLSNLSEIRTLGERLEYRICVAEGSPEVVRYLAQEDVNAIVGVGCLDSLEKVFGKVSALGVPSVAVPLHEAGCKDTRVDTRFISWLLESQGREVAERTHTFLPFLRMAHRLFDTDEFETLLAGMLPDDADPTARMAVDWLRLPGKRLRPFFALSAFHAFRPDGAAADGIKHLAMAVEAFHKASLVHDDIEDDEDLRYGGAPLHVAHGIPIAINAGDYLIGLGYRLAAKAAEASQTPGASGELLRIFSATQMILTQGQGMELFWRKGGGAPLAFESALRCSMQKTSAAFEAALATAIALAGHYAPHAAAIKEFSRYLGAAFQLKNDIQGVEADARRAHPTMLLALATERATAEEQSVLFRPGHPAAILDIYARRQVFERAEQLASRLRSHALDVARDHAGPLGSLFHLLVETVLG